MEGSPDVPDGIAMVKILLGLPCMNVLEVLDDRQLHRDVELADIYGSRSACGLHHFVRSTV